jgi:AcrR family transcriptional regulator
LKGANPATAAARDQPQKERRLRQRQRLRLIEACISALHQYGPSRTTIDKVVTIADMSPGIVNFYFDTKAALLVAALEHLAVEFEASVLAPVEALRSIWTRRSPARVRFRYGIHFGERPARAASISPFAASVMLPSAIWCAV